MKLRPIYMPGGIFRSQATYRAFTILEMLVSVAIFMLVSVGISSIYINIIRSQRDVFVSQDIQESLRFAAETMSKELRTAQVNDRDGDSSSNWTATDVASSLQYWHFRQTNTSEVFFKDQDNKLMHYFLDDGRLMKQIKGDVALPITPEDIQISSLNFYIFDDGTLKPILTISMAARSNLDQTAETVIQTSVTSRDYE